MSTTLSTPANVDQLKQDPGSESPPDFREPEDFAIDTDPAEIDGDAESPATTGSSRVLEGRYIVVFDGAVQFRSHKKHLARVFMKATKRLDAEIFKRNLGAEFGFSDPPAPIPKIGKHASLKLRKVFRLAIVEKISGDVIAIGRCVSWKDSRKIFRRIDQKSLRLTLLVPGDPLNPIET